jgi:inner membrane transporter RhtA
MARRLVFQVRLGLHDPPRDRAARQLPHDDFAEQEASERHRIARNPGTFERADPRGRNGALRPVNTNGGNDNLQELRDLWIIVTPSPPFKSYPVVLSVCVLMVAMVSVQIGAALVKGLFPLVGVSGATALRLILASLMLLAAWRPWRLRPSARETRNLLIYGFAMGWMNFFFYSSLSRIPLGVAVALEFTGPLAVAIGASRRAIDYLWIVLAALGLLALLPLGAGSKSLSAVGVAFALAAGFCWALYIVFGQKAGAVHGGATAALGTVVGAAVIAPIGLAHAGAALFAPAILPTACGVALLSSALPYSLEMYALTRLPTRTFGVLMSAEPALGALSGLVFLHESLTAIQWAAIASIMIASGGSAATSRPSPSPPFKD